MYASLLECHLLAECECGTGPSSMEAILTGSTAALEPKDKIVLPRWSAAAGHLRGVPLAELLAQIMASKSGVDAKRPANGRSANKGASKSAVAPLILDLAAGLAWSEKVQRSGRAVIVFSESVAKEPAPHAEALHFAFTRKLPLVIVSRIKQSGTRSTNDALAQIFERSGIPCIAVDGNDAVAIYRVAGESLRRARDGGGPTWIDCHAGPWRRALARKSSYGPAAERDAWQPRSPLEQMEYYLTRRGLFSTAWQTHIREQFQSRLRQAMLDAGKLRSAIPLGGAQGIYCMETGE
jgi:pyruvate dehydrogenase E1 component alpha subunit